MSGFSGKKKMFLPLPGLEARASSLYQCRSMGYAKLVRRNDAVLGEDVESGSVG